jgi:hypothetical protein
MLKRLFATLGDVWFVAVLLLAFELMSCGSVQQPVGAACVLDASAIDSCTL